MAIAGNSVNELAMTLFTNNPGAFSQQLHFYLDVNGYLVEKVFDLKGTTASPITEQPMEEGARE